MHTIESIRAAWAADGVRYSTEAPHGFRVLFYRNGLVAWWYTTGCERPLWTPETGDTPGTLDDLARVLRLQERR